MDAVIMITLILLSLPRLALRGIFFRIISFLGCLIWGIFKLLAISFARVISAFFFALLICPIRILELLFSHHSPPLYGTSIRTTKNSTPGHESRGGSKAGMDGIPNDWVTIRLCGTDEISDFQLDDTTVIIAKTVDGIFDGWIGSWEKRELFVTTKAEINVKVSEWLKALEDSSGRS
jgi:hypothetical protein